LGSVGGEKVGKFCGRKKGFQQNFHLLWVPNRSFLAPSPSPIIRVKMEAGSGLARVFFGFRWPIVPVARGRRAGGNQERLPGAVGRELKLTAERRGPGR
jgi:hypothetical protein